jgi:predicted peroxiredoxin
MKRYLMIESRNPFESADSGRWCELAADLKRAGHDVALFLVQNGVLPVRPKARGDGVERALKAGVEVFADDFSLRERGIEAPVRGVQVAPIDVVIDLMAAGWSPIWH